MFQSPRHFVRVAAERWPDAVAVRSGAQVLSYDELASQAEDLARVFGDAGIGAGDQVALRLGNSLAYILIQAALLSTGATIIALPPVTTDPELERVLASSGAGFALLARADTDEQLSATSAPWPGQALEAFAGLSVFVNPGKATRIETRPETEDGVLLRRLSSGSTGAGKHVFKREAAIYFNARSFCEMLSIGSEDRFLGCAPYHHGFGSKNTFAAQLSGASVTVVERFLPASVLQVAARDRITVFPATPPMLDALAHCRVPPGAESAFDELRVCPVGAARLSKAAHDAFFERFGISAITQYGTVETNTVTMDVEPGFVEGRVGRCLPGMEAAVFDEAGKQCPDGDEGEVGVRGITIARGYEQSGAGPSGTFRDGWVFPGDRGFIDADGCLNLTGRQNLVNVGGDKVYPPEIEALVRSVSGVREVIVDAGELNGRPVVRAWVETGGSKVEIASIKAVCRDQLSPHKVPALIHLIDAFPRTESGKVRRADLEKLV